MWNIYTTATKVIVWLGPSQDGSDEVFDAIPQLCLDFSKVPEGAGNLRNLHTFGLPPREDPTWLALEHLYCRPWFQRLWIVQEAILAQELCVMCGTKQLQWGQLCAISEATRRYALTLLWTPVATKQCRNTLDLIGNMNRVREVRGAKVPAALILHISRVQATKDPIDRVYGVLGLLEPEIRQSIHVDYSTESRAQYWRAYVQLFRSLLIEEGPKMLIILDSSSKNPELPSWCPDLNGGGGTQSIPYVGYSAGGRPSQRGLTVEPITACPESDEVQIPGINADTVIDTAELTDLSHWSEMPAEIPKHFSHMASADTRGRELLERLRPRFDVPISQYARTLVANQDRKKRCEYPPGQVEEDYEAMFREIRSYSASGRRPVGQSSERKSPYLNSISSVCDGRSFFATEKGRIGVGPRAIRPGDHVCVFFSGYCPWILRRELGASTYRILGDSYVEGLMKGEIYDLFDIEKDGYETFRVV
jgi:Heterokaryon incompatibility protein (HET)